MVVTHQGAFLLLYGRNAGDPELDEAQRRVERTIAEAIDPLIAAGLDPEHRRFLAYAVVGMAEGASRRWVAAGGGNFAALAKANSDDATSAAKDGDFGTIRSTDNLPDAIRTAIFALNPGELSQPVKQPNGFYLFRAEEVTPQPEAEVQEEIVTQLKQAHFKSWMDNISNSLNYKVLDEGFFNQAEAGAPASGK